MCKIITPILLTVSLLITGCRAHKSQPQMPPLRVVTAEAVLDSLPVRTSFIGYLSSNFDAVIQPRVNGYLSSRHYDYGMPVRRGQLLFTIDPVQLSTTMLAAEAALQSATAQAVAARNNYQRAVPLARINAISASQLDQYTAQYKAAEASVNSARQTLQSARLDVGYTNLYSPINGVAADTKAQVGDFVGPGTQFSVLTTISNLDTMTVDVAIPMAQYLRYARPGQSVYDNAGLLSDIRLVLADGSVYPHAGIYNYTRKDVSSNAGTIVLVVMFPNPELTLKAGQFARIETNIGPRRGRVVVPQQAIDQAQGINSVWIVKPDSTAEYRRVEPGDTYGKLWGIDSGVTAGEQVVISGRQKLHNGARVVPVKM